MKTSYFILAFFFVLFTLVVALASGGLFPSAGGNVGMRKLYINEEPIVVPAREIPQTDEVFIRSASITGDRLVLALTYSGCASHTFSLYVDDISFDTDSRQVRSFIYHNRHGASCEQSTQKVIDFDLSSLMEKYREDFRLIVEDYEGNIMSVDVPVLE